jgi:hypothetical protein
LFFFLPDRLVPKRYKGVKRRYWNECASLALLFILGASLAIFVKNFENGLIPWETWEKIRFYLHNKYQMCPLCGATRSFVFMCRGALVSALHYSLFGTFFFFAGIFNLVAKFILLKFQPSSKFISFINFIDNKFSLTFLIFLCWILQLALHYTGMFAWYTIR